ncbi:hypothetical protein IC619_016385 [Hazenella sp. IB182353]|nr:hypothetical protein [Polycladospora coralii]
MNAMTNSLYGYAGGNPISYIDPDGHLPVEVGSDPYSEAYTNPLKAFKKANGGVGYGSTIPATSSLRSKPPKTQRVHRRNGTGSSGRSGGVFTAPKPVYTKTSLSTMAGGSCERTLAGCPYQPDAITNFIDSFTPEERLDFIFMVMDAATVIDLLLVSHGGVALLSQGAKGVLKQGLKEGAKKQAGKFIGDTKALLSHEKRVVDDLVADGKVVKSIARDPKKGTSDFEIDGVITELKTLENNNLNTATKRIKTPFKKQGAEAVILDARAGDMSREAALSVIKRAEGTFPNKQLPGRVEIWIKGGKVTN